jgi:uncharacterized protein (DUF433 family)
MTTETVSPHVTVGDDRVAYVAGTTLKVREIVLEHLAHGWSPEELHFQHGGRISMAQIHAALAYYFDHKDALDAEIERELREAQALRNRLDDPVLRQRLRAHRERR